MALADSIRSEVNMQSIKRSELTLSHRSTHCITVTEVGAMSEARECGKRKERGYSHHC